MPKQKPEITVTLSDGTILEGDSRMSEERRSCGCGDMMPPAPGIAGIMPPGGCCHRPTAPVDEMYDGLKHQISSAKAKLSMRPDMGLRKKAKK